MKKLKYEGPGEICQFGEFKDGWTGEKPDTEADLLLKVPGFSEVELEVKTKKLKKEGN